MSSHVRPLRPGAWLTEARGPGFGVRGAVLVGSERAAVWDTLCRPADMEPVLPLVRGRDLVIVYSHADWDHVWGTAGLPDAREVVAHRVARERLTRDGEAQLAAGRAREPGCYDDVRLVLPTSTFEDRRRVDLGGLTLDLQALPGHTADSIVAWVPELGVLLAGDAVEAPLPEVNEHSRLGAWIEELEAWSEAPEVELVIPGHGEVGGRGLLLRTARYLRALRVGATDPPAAPLDAFYSAVHERNVALVREGRTGR